MHVSCLALSSFRIFHGGLCCLRLACHGRKALEAAPVPRIPYHLGQHVVKGLALATLSIMVPTVISVCKLIESCCPSSPSIPKASCHAQGNVPSGTPSLLKPDCHSRSRAMLDRHSCASLADYQHSESQGVTQGVRHLAKEVGS